MTVILYLPQRVRITRFDCSQTGFGKQLAFVFHKTHPHMFTRSVCAHYMHDLCMHVMTRGKKTKQNKKKKQATNLHDTRVQMIPWNCRHVSWCLRPPWRGGGSSLLILESCEEAGERWSCWAWFSRAKLGKRGRGFTPPRPRPPPEATRTHFQANICGVGNWKKATEWRREVDSAGFRAKKEKKSIQAHGGPASGATVAAMWWRMCMRVCLCDLVWPFLRQRVPRLRFTHWCLRASLCVLLCVRPCAVYDLSTAPCLFARVKFAISPAGKG